MYGANYHEDNDLQDDDDNVSAPGTLSKFLTGTYLVRKLLVPTSGFSPVT